jgi:hypothetical protein
MSYLVVMTHTYREQHELLHRLWSRAVGTPDYHKADWKALERILDDLWHAATGKHPTLAEINGTASQSLQGPVVSPSADRPTAWKRILGR